MEQEPRQRVSPSWLFSFISLEVEASLAELFGAVARLDVYVTTALKEEALLVGVVLWIALCWLDLIASPEDAIGTDGV